MVPICLNTRVFLIFSRGPKTLESRAAVDVVESVSYARGPRVPNDFVQRWGPIYPVYGNGINGHRSGNNQYAKGIGQHVCVQTFINFKHAGLTDAFQIDNGVGAGVTPISTKQLRPAVPSTTVPRP